LIAFCACNVFNRLLTTIQRNLQKFTKQVNAGGFTAEKLFGAVPSLVLWYV
jgi:hypothetical protein